MYIWSPEKFEEKLMMMRDVLSTYEAEGDLPDLDP